jgi:two-component system, OmpR family, response regulator
MHVVVVDDEPRLVEIVVGHLIESGFTATGFRDGVTGLRAAREPGVDALVLDLLLPGMNGIDVCRELRRGGSDVYVLMLTARGTVQERVVGLDAGADDYLVKPFALEELSARLRAVHRRRREDDDRRLTVGDLVLDPLAQRVWRADTEVELSRREFAVLRALMENAGRVVSRSYIFDQVWDGEADLSSNAIDVHVSKLRARIDKPFGTDTITTMRGLGYRLETGPR